MEVSDEDTDTIKEFLDEGGYDITIGHDFEGDAMMKYGIQFIPATFLIDSKGVVADTLIGANSYDTYKSKIDAMN